MAVLGASDNQVNVLVKTSADTSGISQTQKGMDSLGMSTSKMTQAVFMGNAAFEASKNILRSSADFINQSKEAANRYQSALIGLSSVSRAFGQDQQLANEAAQSLASDGLMTVRDSATSLKNLLATGFSLEEATTLIMRFKDSAAFGRQAALGFGEAIRGATEGIKNGNSILVDNAGVTKNLSVILDQAGKSQQDVMNITSDASVRQALYNGLLRETTAQLGDAERLTQTYAGAEARAAAEVEKLKQSVGALTQAVGFGLMTAFTSFLGSNQQAIISFGGAAIAAVGAAAGVYAVVAAIRAFSVASLMAVVSNPLLLMLTAIAALAGVVVYKALNKMQDKVAESNKQMGNMGKTLGGTIPPQAEKATKAMGELAKKLSDIDENIIKAKRDFKEQLATIIKDHQDKVKSLQRQLNDETASYDEANKDRNEEFKKSQDEMADEHQEKVNEIKRQLDRQTALGKWANQQEIAELQTKLAQEEAAYAKQTAEAQARYDEEVAKAKASYTQKKTELETQLAEEKGLLDKHSADVAAVRDVMLLDEIEKLKRSHNEQLVAFDKQKAAAISNAEQTAAGVGGVWDNANAGMNTKFAGLGDEMGKSMGNAFKGVLADSFKETAKDLWKWWEDLMDSMFGWAEDLGKMAKKIKMPNLSIPIPGRALGGPVSAGHEYRVNERGQEYFRPRESGEIIPVGQAPASAGKNVTFNQTNHIYNQFDLSSANRELGWRLANA